MLQRQYGIPPVTECEQFTRSPEQLRCRIMTSSFQKHLLDQRYCWLMLDVYMEQEVCASCKSHILLNRPNSHRLRLTEKQKLFVINYKTQLTSFFLHKSKTLEESVQEATADMISAASASCWASRQIRSEPLLDQNLIQLCVLTFTAWHHPLEKHTGRINYLGREICLAASGLTEGCCTAGCGNGRRLRTFWSRSRTLTRKPSCRHVPVAPGWISRCSGP